MATDALGNPVRWLLSAGQAHDLTQAPALIAGFRVDQIIADKAFDSNGFLALIEAAGAEAVIPPSSVRVRQRSYDRHAYRERHLIECLFNRLKQFRRIATRYEKLARNFLSMVTLATAYVWLA